MPRLAWFFIGVLSVVAALLIGGWVWIARAHGFSANEQPTAIETWLAEEARSMALPSNVNDAKNPIPNTPDVLSEARAHWADHCAICHANDGSGDTQIGTHTYPKAPDMRRQGTQKMSDGELFYIIQNGVRMSAMPAWGGTPQDAQDSWKLVHFIRHLPQVTTEEKQEMEKLNPKGPDDRREEEEEQKFLNGEDANEQPAEHHHH